MRAARMNQDLQLLLNEVMDLIDVKPILLRTQAGLNALRI